jgi:MerR family transcriptional regulator, light-induced transcriptional regulator
MDKLVKDFSNHLLQGDLYESWQHINQLSHKQHDSFFIYNNVIAKAMQLIGDRWENNELSVVDEHLATSICDLIISRYAYTKNKTLQSNNHSMRAMFFCMEGEQHFLGLKMISCLFEEHSWQTHLLGPDLPLQYALYAAERFQPKVIGLSLTLTTQLPQLKVYIEALQPLSSSPTIFVGGRMTTLYSLSSVCSKDVHIIHDINEIKSFLTQSDHSPILL